VADINQLSATDTLNAGDLVPIWKTNNGDTRKASISVLQSYMQNNLNFSNVEFVSQYASPAATGFTVTLTNNSDNRWLILLPVAAYASGTIVLPALANLADNQEIIITSTQSVTSLTVNANGANIVGSPTSITAGGSFRLKFNSFTSTWYRIDEITDKNFIDNIAALRLLNTTTIVNQVVLARNYVAGDGGGIFRYDSTDTTTADNGGTVIVDAAGRRWKRQYSDVLNIKWWDYTTSANTALGSMMSLAAASVVTVGSRSFGPVMYIPSGIYTGITKRTLFSGAIIKGDGPESTILRLADNRNEDMFYAQSKNGILIADVSLDGRRSSGNDAPPVNTGNGIALWDCDRSSVINVYSGFCGGNGILVAGGEFINIENCNVEGNSENGIYTTTTSLGTNDGPEQLSLSNLKTWDNDTDGCCFDPGSRAVTASGIISYSNGGTGVNVFGNPSGDFPRLVSLSSIVTYDNSLEGLSIHASVDVTVSSMTNSGNGAANTAGRNNGVIIQNDFNGQAVTNRISISNATISGPYGHGIFIDKIPGVTNGLKNISISDVIIENPGSVAGFAGIYSDEVENLSLSNVSIVDSRSPQLMDYAIETTSSSTNVLITGGNISTGTAGTITGAGTWTANRLSAGSTELLSDTENKGLFIGGPRSRPRAAMKSDLVTLQTRWIAATDAWYVGLHSVNLDYTSDWNLDDTTRVGWVWGGDSDQDVWRIRRAAAGSNPRTLSEVLVVDASQSVRAGTNNTQDLGTSAIRWKHGYMVNLTLSPGSSLTPANNGDLSIEATNNTTLTFKYKGSDGTVRSGTVALS
jgi:hypothetical protein